MTAGQIGFVAGFVIGAMLCLNTAAVLLIAQRWLSTVTGGKMFDFPRSRALMFPTRVRLTPDYRRVIFGLFEQALKATAKRIGTPVSDFRAVRLNLASQIWQRKIDSFNQLEDCEVWAFQQWIGTIEGKRNAYAVFKKWLTAEYGEQQQLPMSNTAE